MEEIINKEPEKKERTPTYAGKQKKIYQRGYDSGFKDAKRLKERLSKAKLYVIALHNLFKQQKD